MYFLLLNGVRDRIIQVFELIGVQPSYYESRFRPFITARRWANFFNHPNSFAYLAHHSGYTILDFDDYKDNKYRNRMEYLERHAQTMIIDSEFVEVHCTNNAKKQSDIKNIKTLVHQ